MVAPPSCIETKLNVSTQLQTFLFPMVSKAFPYSNALVLCCIHKLYHLEDWHFCMSHF